MKKQETRYNEAEMAVIESHFKNNDELLMAIRKVFLQGDLTDAEVKLLKTLKEPVLNVIEKQVVPKLDTNAPFFMLSHNFIALRGELSGQSVESSYPLILAKQLEVDYLNQQMAELRGSKKGKIKLAELIKVEGKEKLELFVNITAWNFILSYIDSCLRNLAIIGGNELAKQELAERIAKNSTK